MLTSHRRIIPQNPVTPPGQYLVGENQIPGFPLEFSHYQGSVAQWEPTSAEATKCISSRSHPWH